MTYEERQEKLRTARQNRSQYKFFDNFAKYCIEHGIDIKVIFKDVRVTPTPKTIKMYWDGIMKEKYGYDSTTQLTTTEMTEMYDEFNKILAMHGHHVPFPSQENTEEYLNSYVQNS